MLKMCNELEIEKPKMYSLLFKPLIMAMLSVMGFTGLSKNQRKIHNVFHGSKLQF